MLQRIQDVLRDGVMRVKAQDLLLNFRSASQF